MEAKNKSPFRRRARTSESEAAKIQGKSKTEKCPLVLAGRRLMVTLVRAAGGEDQEQEFRVIMRQNLRGSECQPLFEDGQYRFTRQGSLWNT